MPAFESTPLFERPTLSAQVARHLLNLIAREGLRPGDAAPSEAQRRREGAQKKMPSRVAMVPFPSLTR